MQFNMFFKKEMYQKYVDADGFENMNKKLDKSLSMRFPQKLYRIIASISDSENTIELRYNGGILDTIKLSDYYANERSIILWHALGGHIAHWVSTSSLLPKSTCIPFFVGIIYIHSPFSPSIISDPMPSISLHACHIIFLNYRQTFPVCLFWYHLQLSN